MTAYTHKKRKPSLYETVANTANLAVKLLGFYDPADSSTYGKDAEGTGTASNPLWLWNLTGGGDLATNPSGGVSLIRGHAVSDTEARQPFFQGTVGGESNRECFRFDALNHGKFFNAIAQPRHAQSMHTDSANWTFMFWGSRGKNISEVDYVFSTANDGVTSIGVNLGISPANGLFTMTTNGSAVNMTVNTSTLTNSNNYRGNWALYGWSFGDFATHNFCMANSTGFMSETKDFYPNNYNGAVCTSLMKVGARNGTSNSADFFCWGNDNSDLNINATAEAKWGVCAIWDRALAQTEMQEFYNATVDRYYPFTSIGLGANLQLYLDPQVRGSYYGGNVAPVISMTDYQATSTDANNFNFTCNIGPANEHRVVIVAAAGANAGGTITATGVNIAGSAATLHIAPSSNAVPTAIASRTVATGTTATINVRFNLVVTQFTMRVYTMLDWMNTTPFSSNGLNVGANTTITRTLDMPDNGIGICVGGAEGSLTGEFSTFSHNDRNESTPLSSIIGIKGVTNRGTASEESITWGSSAARTGMSIVTWPGSNQHVFDISGQNNHFHLGESLGTFPDTTDPTFVVGQTTPPYSYFTLDSGEFISYRASISAQPSWVEDMHQDGANFTLAFWYYTPDSANTENCLIQTFSDGGIGNGINFYVGTGNTAFQVWDAGALDVLNGGTVYGPAVANNTWQLLTVSVNEATGPGGLILGVNNTFVTNNSTYTTPSTGTTQAKMLLYVGSTLNGRRAGEAVIWNRALTQAEINTYFQHTRSKYGV